MLYVGRIERSSAWKGLDVLLGAFAQIARAVPAARLELVGDGDAVDGLRRLAVGLGVQDRVDFRGALSGAELVAAYRRASVVALPSLTEAESFGMTLVEGMSCGRPVIGSRVGGIPGVVTDGHDGLLVPPGDPRRAGGRGPGRADRRRPGRPARSGRAADRGVPVRLESAAARIPGAVPGAARPRPGPVRRGDPDAGRDPDDQRGGPLMAAVQTRPDRDGAGTAELGPDRDALRAFGTLLGVLGLIVLNLFVLAGAGGPPRAVLGFPVAVLLPGALALRVIGPDRVTGWTWLVRVVALSTAGLTAIGLVLALLPGAALSAAGSLIGLDLLVGGLAVALAVRHRSHPGTAARRTASTAAGTAARTPRPAPTAAAARRAGPRAGSSGWPGRGPGVALRLPAPDRTMAVLAAATLLPGAAGVWLAVAGAVRLDHGGSSATSVAALACAALAVVPAALAVRRPGGERIAGAGLYLLALAVLLVTSLRGNGVTGHDIKIEYRVFLETFTAGSWGPGGDNVSYNSCLSITVLPSVLARLLGLAPLDVFAVCFPLLFAVVPVVVVLIARRLLPPVQALAAGVLFVAFPTFVNDMTMLNRQAIATVFFAVAVLTLLDERPSRRRTGLLAVLAVALTVSHYTTTYVAVGLLLLAWAILAAPRLVRRPPALTRTGLGRVGALLAVLAVGWALISGTAPVVRGTVRDAAAAIGTDATVSSDATSYSLIGGSRKQSDAEALERYLDGLRASTAAEPVVPAGTAVRGPADPGRRAAGHHGRHRAGGPGRPARHRQLGATPGGGGALPGRRRDRRAAAVVADPVRAPSRGVAGPGRSGAGRAGRRCPAAAGRHRARPAAVRRVRPAAAVPAGPDRARGRGRGDRGRAGPPAARRCRGPAAVAIAIGCLLTTSGLVPQLLGGYSPQLNLNNAGAYYHAYYAQESDLNADSWIDGHLDHGRAVVADSRDSANVRALTGLFPRTGLAPGVVAGHRAGDRHQPGRPGRDGHGDRRGPGAALPVPAGVRHGRPAAAARRRHPAGLRHGTEPVSPIRATRDQVRRLVRDSLLRNSAMLVLAAVELSFGGFLFWQLATHLFSPAEVGRAGVLISASTLIATLALLGMNSSLVRFLGEWPDPARTVNSGSMLVAIAATVGALGYALGAAVLAPDLARRRRPDRRVRAAHRRCRDQHVQRQPVRRGPAQRVRARPDHAGGGAADGAAAGPALGRRVRVVHRVLACRRGADAGVPGGDVPPPRPAAAVRARRPAAEGDVAVRGRLLRGLDPPDTCRP